MTAIKNHSLILRFRACMSVYGSSCFLNNFLYRNACKLYIFLFFKNYFWYQHIKTIQNVQIILNYSKKNFFEFHGNAVSTVFPNEFLIQLREWWINIRIDLKKNRREESYALWFVSACFSWDFPCLMIRIARSIS